MLQILGLLALSWLLVWLFDRNNLCVLGFKPTKERLKLMALLFIVTAICCATTYLMKAYFLKEKYILNFWINANTILHGVWQTFRGVVTEELMCRGVLLYILIRKVKIKWAIIISSIAFGLLHWLNAGVFGNIILMCTIFLFTFTMGLLLAYAYIKTESILIPIAIHFGWNLTQNFIFPDPIDGFHIFILAEQPPSVTVSYFVFFLLIVFPKASAIGFNYFILKRQNLVNLPKVIS